MSSGLFRSRRSVCPSAHTLRSGRGTPREGEPVVPLGAGVGAGVGASVVVDVVVDTPGLRDKTSSLAVGRRRKDSKAHLTPEIETDYPYIEVIQIGTLIMRVKQIRP